jgi:hypothetical protein
MATINLSALESMLPAGSNAPNSSPMMAGVYPLAASMIRSRYPEIVDNKNGVPVTVGAPDSEPNYGGFLNKRISIPGQTPETGRQTLTNDAAINLVETILHEYGHVKQDKVGSPAKTALKTMTGATPQLLETALQRSELPSTYESRGEKQLNEMLASAFSLNAIKQFTGLTSPKTRAMDRSLSAIQSQYPIVDPIIQQFIGKQGTKP